MNALSSGAVSIATIAAVGGGIYLLFFGLGIAYAIAFSFSECQKLDVNSALQEAAWWGLYPFAGWVFSNIPYVRIQFDKFFIMFGMSSETAVWVSFGYVLMLASIAGIFNLRASAVQAACKPTVDEADEFRKRMLERQRARNAELAAAAETTPAVLPV